MGYNQEAYGAECPGTGKCHTTIYDPGAGHDLHRRPSSHQADDIGRAWPRPEVCAPATKTHRHTAAAQTGHHQHTRGCQETRRPTSGLSSQRRSQTPVGWNGCHIQTEQRLARCPSPGPSPTLSARSPGRSGQRHDSGREAGPPRRSTRCRKARGRTARLQEAPRG